MFMMFKFYIEQNFPSNLTSLKFRESLKFAWLFLKKGSEGECVMMNYYHLTTRE